MKTKKETKETLALKKFIGQWRTMLGTGWVDFDGFLQARTDQTFMHLYAAIGTLVLPDGKNVISHKAGCKAGVCCETVYRLTAAARKYVRSM